METDSWHNPVQTDSHVIPHVTDHVISLTAHGTVSRMPSHFDSPLAVSVSGSHGDAVRGEVADDADSRYGYFAVAMHKLAEIACPHTCSPFLVIQNVSRGTLGAYAWGVALPPAS